MLDQTPASRARRVADLALLDEVRAELAATPDSAALAALQSRCQALAAGPDALVAEAAAIVELRVLGAMLQRQAAEMRALAARLTGAMRWLPPAQVGHN